VTLRRATPDDADDFARLMGDESVFGNLLQMPYPSADAWRARLAAPAAGAAPTIDLHLVAVHDGRVVGSAGLHPTGPALRRRHVAVLGISVARGAQGRGVGTALMAALCDYTDRWAGVLRIELTVFTDNALAAALYRRFGFVVEGTHRGYALRDGQFADVYTMARWHPNPPMQPPAGLEPSRVPDTT
jgi:L-phenylalanine/L-methionine N-acetyltransferase